MKLLIIDEYLSLGQAIKDYMAKAYEKIDITFITKISNIKDELHSNIVYDIVIVNFGNFNNVKLLNELLLYNQKQRIVIISGDTKCTDRLGCNHCLMNHNKIRLIPPFKDYDIVDKILDLDNKQCPHYGHCEKYIFRL
ncbi:MAG: hypothetical protein M0P43_02925 [Arcobacteraceae bacterium]|nr:hypothetical protein [Arcobacteraceae bacterium]MDY0328535.1 hypothetical protein [Arcobacteraceae bacterium]